MVWKIRVPVKKLAQDARVPEFKTDGAAGADLYALSPAGIKAGGRRLLDTGIAMAIPEGYVGLIRDKSGNANKKGITVLAGVVDSDYRGEIKVLLHNTGEYTADIWPGDAIAQILFVPVEQAQFQEVSDLDDTERGSGGFGSTGGDIK
jgi:dUTP pyrophosphatase